ncbi:hypothetical protein Hdeb2414_s0002g00054841 [Helianthus debilis subsp. tardiflorus]
MLVAFQARHPLVLENTRSATVMVAAHGCSDGQRQEDEESEKRSRRRRSRRRQWRRRRWLLFSGESPDEMMMKMMDGTATGATD